MPCENPNIRVQIKDSKSGALKYRFLNMRKFCKGGYNGEWNGISYKANGIKKEPDHHGRGYKFNVAEQQWLENMLAADRAQIIPCMKCEYCQKMISNKWSARVELEAKQYRHKAFLTLTYEPEYLPVLNISTGEIYRGYFDEAAAQLDIEERKFRSPERGRLNPDDVTGFLKRLRSDAEYHHRAEKPTQNSLGIEYFYCGEYGSKNFRPHYHMILLGYIVPDAQHHSWKTYDDGTKSEIFESEVLTKLWGKGIVSVQAVEQGSIGYTTGYCQKKGKYFATQDAKGNLDFRTYDELFREFGLQPEYRRMSQGMGKQYCLDHIDTIMTHHGGELAHGKQLPSITYFDKIVDNYNASLEPDKTEDATEEEAQSTMKSEYMRKEKERRRNNAYGTQLNDRINHGGRYIMEHIAAEAENAKRERKNKTRQEKGDF